MHAIAATRITLKPLPPCIRVQDRFSFSFESAEGARLKLVVRGANAH
jgi:hypothetical protein